jgi:NADPH-dependent stearoyl-CoA 9-desaturase
MAITDIKQYAHLTEADVEELARELDAIRTDIEESRGEGDARYVRRTIQLQRALAAGGRIALMASRNKVAWVAGTAMLAAAKIIENMELGHNITHGQWDWMNDPEIHSTEWEWDTTSPSVQWKKSHNFVHHKYTNIVGMDDDVGYGLLRVTRDHTGTNGILATRSTTCCSEHFSSGELRCTGWNCRRSAEARNPRARSFGTCG